MSEERRSSSSRVPRSDARTESAPTAEEFMLFADGELEPARADEVVAYLAAHPAEWARVDSVLAMGHLVGEWALERVTTVEPGSVANAVMERLAEESRGVRRPVNRRAATVRRVTFGAVLAAAAAFALWVGVSGHRAWLHPGLSGGETLAAAAVTVDAVDFGARAGSIFYVPSSTDKTTTPVVWLTDDDSDESGEKL